MLVDEKNVVFEARVQMWFEAEVHHDRVMMTINMGIDSVQPLEELAEEARESLGERNACARKSAKAFTGPCLGYTPIRLGNICSLSMLPCTQLIRCSIYSGADILVGRL